MFLKPFVADRWILESSPSPDGEAVVARVQEQGAGGIPLPSRWSARLSRAGGVVMGSGQGADTRWVMPGWAGDREADVSWAVPGRAGNGAGSTGQGH
jgi:hypothetical protein